MADEPLAGTITSSFAGVPDEVRELAQSLTDFVTTVVGIRPDFTPETLPLVDHYLTTARDGLRGRPELLDLTAQATGAYFGEVVRRHLAGFWLLPSDNKSDWLVCGEAAFVALNPIGVGYEAVSGSLEHSGPSAQIKLAGEDRQGVADRLALLPEVDESEYFSLSTRFEVLEIVMEAVRAQAIARGYDETTYDARDYGSDLQPLHLL